MRTLFSTPQAHFNDDDGDLTEVLPFDLSQFVNALARAPVMAHGFGLHDIHKVECAWEFLDTDYSAHGYLVDLVDGRPVLLEIQQDLGSDDGDKLTIEVLAPATLPRRRSADEEMAAWYHAHHITMHIAELKLLPLLDG